MCSTLLVAPLAEGGEGVGGEVAEDPQVPYKTGELACPSVFQTTLPLSDRLKPTAVLRSLQTLLVRWHARKTVPARSPRISKHSVPGPSGDCRSAEPTELLCAPRGSRRLLRAVVGA
jgi:hypothetical protein